MRSSRSARARSCCSSTAWAATTRRWDPVIDSLARRYTVIAPDLLGHGQSAKPRADYSIGGYANAMRDLLTVLGIETVTVVGHSLGGGVAMQFAYQFPERTERMVLVAPGGIGPDVTRAIRAVTLPLFQQFMGLATLPGDPARRRRGAARALPHRHLPDPRPRRGGHHLRVVPRPRLPCRDRPRGARLRGLEGPDHHHGRPRLPDRRHADVRDLGQGRRRDPGVARGDRTQRSRRAPTSRSSRTPATSCTRTIRSGSSSCSTTSCARREPASHDRSDWREMLTNGPESPAVRERAGRAAVAPGRPAVAAPYEFGIAQRSSSAGAPAGGCSHHAISPKIDAHRPADVSRAARNRSHRGLADEVRRDR